MTLGYPQTDDAATIAVNLANVSARIAAAARGVGRPPEEITLVAVTKAHGPERILPALAAGHRVFGENRVKEAQEKWPALKGLHADIELRFIGPLQTNKARAAVALFDVIETVDRVDLARSLAKEMAQSDRWPPCYVQVNTGEEPQKAGVMPGEVDALIKTCRGEIGLPVVGLMCLPPLDEEPALHFALLREIARRHGLGKLSMGMSGDFEIAVAFGATSVRVGTSIFGPRPNDG